jgi:hypothetical protein
VLREYTAQEAVTNAKSCHQNTFAHFCTLRTLQDLWRSKEEWMKKAAEWYGDNIYNKVHCMANLPT